MRRPNHASRSSASMVVGAGATGERRLPPAGASRGGASSPGGLAGAEATLRPGSRAGDQRALAMTTGSTGGGAADTSTLAGLEQSVLALKKELEAEQAEVVLLQNSLSELFMRNACEEYLRKLERRIQTIENKEVETVQWRIENVEDLRSKLKKGEHVASPEFSACGLSGFSFHFYPKGDDFAEEGYCSLYFHVPSDTTVSRTLFLGRAQHGPVEADSLKNCGVSEMCVLSNEIDKATGSIIVGVDGLSLLRSPNVVETRTKLVLSTVPNGS